MRNRAKCKKCNKIIESEFFSDYVMCDCAEIAIWGGLQKAFSEATDYANFLRVDDDGKEIPVKYDAKEENSVKTPPHQDTVTKEMLLQELEEKTSYDLQLPQHVLFSPATTCDLVNYMMIVSAILRKM